MGSVKSFHRQVDLWYPLAKSIDLPFRQRVTAAQRSRDLSGSARMLGTCRPSSTKMAGNGESAAPVESGSVSSFEEWLRDNGGDDELIDLLKTHGFTSKLSLGNLDFTSPDASLFIDQLNYGQKCLLQGLVKLLNKPESSVKNPYSAGASKAASLSTVNKSSSLKEKIGKMFHLDTAKKSSEFKPVHSYMKKSGVKRKASETVGGRGKGPMKKKVKQMRFKIVSLPRMLKRTPTGSKRNQLTHHVWINVDASEEEARKRIADELGWQNPKSIEYHYAQGKNLRKAVLSDIENAESWDVDTLRALMGSGALYVVKSPELDSSDSDSSSDFLSEIKPAVSYISNTGEG